MKIGEDIHWIYYKGTQSYEFKAEKIGKWMYFFDNKNFVANVCEEAVKNNIVASAKHSNKQNGVACFYLNCDDTEAHRKIISFFIENNLIQKTKTGRFYNIPFKLDTQTQTGQYGKDFSSDIKLSQFINLDSGEWLS